MDERWNDGKRTFEYEEEGDDDDEEEELEVSNNNDDEKEKEKGYGEEDGRKKRVVVTTTTTDNDLYSYRKRSAGVGNSKGGGGSSVPPSCQVGSCNADLSGAKQYHRRHKVCEYHAKAHSVLIADLQQRFCQQCSRFHELTEFDDSKRSCRKRLAGHNERRRKNASEYQGE